MLVVDKTAAGRAKTRRQFLQIVCFGQFVSTQIYCGPYNYSSCDSFLLPPFRFLVVVVMLLLMTLLKMLFECIGDGNSFPVAGCLILSIERIFNGDFLVWPFFCLLWVCACVLFWGLCVVDEIVFLVRGCRTISLLSVDVWWWTES